jgi:hypothetical protein
MVEDLRSLALELENTKEILSNKVLDIQELVYYHYKTDWKCCYCGFTVRVKDVPTFDIYKDIVDGHCMKCTEKHMKEFAEKHKNDSEEKTAKELEKLMKQIEKMKDKDGRIVLRLRV